MLKIKEIRESLKMTQDQIVSLSGIKKRSYVDYENGKSDIPLSKLQKIAKCFGVSIGDLLGENKSFSGFTTNLTTDSILDLTEYLFENNDTLMADPIFREYIKSNIITLEIEREKEKLEKMKAEIEEKLNAMHSKVS